MNTFFVGEQYGLFVDQSPFQVYYLDSDLNILFANETILQFNGCSLDDMKGRSILNLIPEESHSLFLSKINQITKASPIIEMENRNIDQNSQVHWFLWTDKGVFNDDGQLVGYQAIGQDITEKKEVEEALKISQARLIEAQRVGRIGVWEWDIQNMSTFWTKETFELCDLTPENGAPSQEDYQALLDPEDSEKMRQGHSYAFNNGKERFIAEYPINLKNGKKRWFLDQAQIIYSPEGWPVKMLGTIQDITLSKELQLSLENHINIENLVLEISMLFMKSDPAYSNMAIHLAVEKIGKGLNADRVYLVLNDLLFTSKEEYLWNRNKVNVEMQPWRGSAEDTPWIFDEFKSSEAVIIPDVSSLQYKAVKDYSYLNEAGVGAFFAAALFFNNQVCGYLCLDSRKPLTDWDGTKTDFLKIISEMCVGALERMQNHRDLEREKEFLSITLMSIGDGFISLGPDDSIQLINHQASLLLGTNDSRIKQKNAFRDLQIRDSETQNVFSYSFLLALTLKKKTEAREAFYLTPDGDQKTFSYSCSEVPGMKGKKPCCALVFRDITEKAKRLNEIAFLSFHDSLTKIYNRAFMEEELKRLDTPRQLPLAVIMGDVNGLKIANDVFGHKEGDQLLKVIAAILTSCCRDEDVVARWGGDEFSIILPRTPQDSADKICERIRMKCEESTGSKITPSIALGSAVKKDNAEDIAEVIREAENRMYRQKILDDRSVRSDILSSLKKTLFEKSFETEAHTKRMLDLAKRFGKSLSLSSNLQSDLNLLAVMHDMGKIAVPKQILVKVEPLTNEDWDEIKKHPETGYRIALSTQELATIADYILFHHERWDGRGYPQGLKGEQIPELSRIISIIDTFDVMTAGRIYCPGVSSEEALVEIESCAGSQFDPFLTEKFVKIKKEEL